MDNFTLASVLTAAGAGVAGIFVASLVQLIKQLLPENMQTGRGIIAVVYALSALLVLGAISATPALAFHDAAGFAATTFVAVFSWQAVAAAAIGANQLARKAQAVASDSTNTTGEDAPLADAGDGQTLNTRTSTDEPQG